MKRVIASSMVHILCLCTVDGSQKYAEFNINIDEPLTPEILKYEIRPKIIKELGTNDFVILNWTRYEMRG